MAARALLVAFAVGAMAAGSLLLTAIDDSREREAEARPPAPCLFAFVSRVEGDRHLERLRVAGRRVSVVAPNWYLLQLPGGRVSGGADGRVRRLARRHRIAVWPVVNARLGFAPALERGGERRRAARAIERLARREGFSGMTLDIEEVRPAERDDFSAFVREVARRLHRAGRWLGVYVPRRGAGRVTRSTAAYDWSALARSADLVLASGYNEHSAFARPGPVTTARGFRDVLRYAGRVSRSRVAPTVGAFGYSWPLVGGGPGRIVPSHEAERLRLDAPRGSRRVGGARTYVSGGREVWYETRAGLAERSRAARRAGFRWIGLFSLGREPAGTLERMRVSGRCGPAAGARRPSSG